MENFAHWIMTSNHFNFREYNTSHGRWC